MSGQLLLPARAFVAPSSLALENDPPSFCFVFGRLDLALHSF